MFFPRHTFSLDKQRHTASATTDTAAMGLGDSGEVKDAIRSDPRLSRCLHYASYSRARRHEISKNEKGNRTGKGIEPGFGVVLVELMLRKRALIKGCQSLKMYARRWRELVRRPPLVP